MRYWSRTSERLPGHLSECGGGEFNATKVPPRRLTWSGVLVAGTGVGFKIQRSECYRSNSVVGATKATDTVDKVAEPNSTATAAQPSPSGTRYTKSVLRALFHRGCCSDRGHTPSSVFVPRRARADDGRTSSTRVQFPRILLPALYSARHRTQAVAYDHTLLSSAEHARHDHPGCATTAALERLHSNVLAPAQSRTITHAAAPSVPLDHFAEVNNSFWALASSRGSRTYTTFKMQICPDLITD
ncbi:hypothetical protein B0H14DRAFT_2656268 [Mycena olivaceomarginata]|nr:hypothetical protein B0H14DRAFT_2656268 [Mycena olivaceomarginata]